MARRLFLTLIAILIVVTGAAPVCSMLVKSLFVGGRFSLSSYAGLLTSVRHWTLMGHSLALSSLVMALTVVVGVPLGILFGKTDLPFRRFFAVLFLVPLVIPPYIVAVSWFDLLGTEGLLAHLAGGSVTRVTSCLLFGFPGCAGVLFSIFLPIPMLLTMVFLRTVDPGLEEAGRLVTGWRGVLKGITIPLIMPGVLLSAMLVFLLSLGEFSVPSYLRYDVFPVESFTQFSAFYDFEAATAAAVPLAAVTLVLLLVESAFLRNKTYSPRPSPGVERLPSIPLGAWRPWLLAPVALLGFVIVVVPVAVLVVQAGGVGSFVEALDRAGGSLSRSLAYAVAGATLLTIMGFFAGYLIRTRALKYWRTVDSLTIFLFALPGTVVGIGLVSLWNTPWTNLVYGTPAIVIVGYLAKYTAITSRISVTQLARIPASMEEAAQVAGAGWFRRMGFIVAPMARRGLLASWLAAYVFTLRDTAITMLVYPAGHETLPVRIFTLMANGTPELIAALCTIMIVATLLPAGIVWVVRGIGTGEAIG